MSLVAAAVGNEAASRARRRRRQANSLAARIELIREHRDIINRLRQTRIAAAQIEAGEANLGIQGSSPTEGAQAALFTDFATEAATARQVSALQRRRIRLGAKADKAQAQSNLFFDIAKAGLTLGLG